MACSGCNKRHDANRCPHGASFDEPAEWLRQALADQQAEREYWETDSDE